jgi:hypothetical protein
MMKYELIIAFVIASVSAGCGAKVYRDPGYTNNAVDTFLPNVLLSMTISRENVSTVHPVEITARIVSRVDDRVSYGNGSSNCQFYLLVIIDGEEHLAYIPRECQKDSIIYYLNAAGANYTERFLWRGQVWDNGEVQDLDAGTYEIVAATSIDYRSDPLTITVIAPPDTTEG